MRSYLLVLITFLLGVGPSFGQVQRKQDGQPFILGVIETIHSRTLGEDRILNIALPPGYSPDSADRYPVIYVLDGSADEDFIHVNGAVQFASLPWIEWLPPSIVVGIANVDRKRDFTYPTNIAKDKADFPTTGGSANFMGFVGEDLIPFIDSTYRTTVDRMLIGQSLGGLFASEVLLKRPELFNRYLIVSPSLWWDDGSLLDGRPAFVNAPSLAPRQVYVSVGKEEEVMVKGAKHLVGLVRKSSAARVGYRRITDLDHANILHQAVMDGFRWMGEQ